ncbi:MAG: glycosyltransferase family 2 protein [Anaerolineaceae bacterium]|jgi:glycosyltransferase involved in cell wall biosynthesis
MPEQPLVSIITPSYNQGAFLEQTLLSVLEQDYPKIEYWVIDGGSSDNSLEIIQQYAPRLAGWVSERDRGQADGVNKGFAKATGEIIGWLNSDDLYHPGAISGAVEAFRQNPDASFVFSDVESIDEHGNAFNLMRYGNWKLADLMSFKIIGQPGVFMRREVLEQAGYLDLSYNYLLDVHLWLRMAAIAEPQYIPGKVWAAARMHSDAKNIAHAEEFGAEAFRLARWLGEDQRFYPLSSRIFNKIWAGAHRINAFYLVEAGRYNEALKAYAQMLRYQPVQQVKTLRRMAYAALSASGFMRSRNWYDRKRKDRYSKPKK